MFENIFTAAQDPSSGQMRKRRLTPDEISKLDKNTRFDLNLIYKRQTKSSVISLRLWSMLPDSGEGRITKILFDIATYSEQAGENGKIKDTVQIYMDVQKFAYFCELLRSGRMRAKVERCAASAERDAASKGLGKVNYSYFPAYQCRGGRTECKILSLYSGYDFRAGRRNENIVFEAAQGPGKKGQNNKTEPDEWNGRNSDKVTKIYIGMKEDELGEMGMAGLTALSILNSWYATGDSEINLALLNPSEKRARDNANAGGDYGRQPSQQRQQPQQDYGYDRRNGYAASGRQAPDGRQNYTAPARQPQQNGGYAAPPSGQQRGNSNAERRSRTDNGYYNDGYAGGSAW